MVCKFYLFIYFITNFYDISRKSYLFPLKVYKFDPKSENCSNKLTVWAVCVETVLVGTTNAIQFRNLK